MRYAVGISQPQPSAWHKAPGPQVDVETGKPDVLWD
jgi:hypothetical protein